ncbi:MAG: hypothetical protein ACOZB0_06745 [Pseudomonadota bacterium]
MKASQKTIAVLATLMTMSASTSALAGLGPCPSPARPPIEADACQPPLPAPVAPRACPAPAPEATGPGAGCGGNAALMGRLGEMAAGGMGIAMTVMGALFGAPE